MQRFDLRSSAIATLLVSLLGAGVDAAAPQGAAASAPASASAPAASESPLLAERLERWLDDGDRELVIQSFRRHPDEVLPFVDRYLETGLKMLEQRAGYDAAMQQYRRGLKFAQAASEAWRDPIFADYAANFASWNEAERLRFRQGQQAYKAGAIALRAGRAAEALERFREAFDLAEPLGDAWGMQMALGGEARAAAALEAWTAAANAAQKAIDLSARLQLRNAEIDYCLICSDARAKLEAHDGGAGHAGQAWRRLNRNDPPERRSRVGEAYASALERIGRNDEAASIRAELSRESAASTASPAGDAATTAAPADGSNAGGAPASGEAGSGAPSSGAAGGR